MKQIIIDFGVDQVRTALVDNGELVEVLIEDLKEDELVGSIFVGVVENILPNKFAFINIGRDQNAFIDLNDSREEQLPKIGQKIILQILKDGTEIKGPLATTEITFTGKYAAVYTNSIMEVGVSKKIEDKKERQRLKELTKKIIPVGYGAILRTSSTGILEDCLTDEINNLVALSSKTLEYAQFTKAPALVYKEDSLSLTLEMFLDESVSDVVINSEAELEKVQKILVGLGVGIKPKFVSTKELFCEYFIQSQFDKALQKKVWLKSGGFIYIEQTEACVVIDVNTGKFLGTKNQQKTLLKTNLEAAVEIAKQIRLRNLSGIIIIDFIDLWNEHDIGKLEQKLAEELKKDRIHVNILGMTELGLMQLTRKRVRKTLSEYMMCKCAVCGGTGKKMR